jgi:hypothetical protein
VQRNEFVCARVSKEGRGKLGEAKARKLAIREAEAARPRGYRKIGKTVVTSSRVPGWGEKYRVTATAQFVSRGKSLQSR